MYVQLTQPYLVVSHCDTMGKKRKNNEKRQQKLCLFYCNIPVHTRKPTVRVHGMPWCAKIYYYTHFGNTMGFSVPVLNPTVDMCYGEICAMR